MCIFLILLAFLSASALVWSTHAYPYPSKKDSDNNNVDERTFENGGGYISVIKCYQMYKRGTGELLQAEVKPLYGLMRAGVAHGLPWERSGYPPIRQHTLLGCEDNFGQPARLSPPATR